MSNDCPGSPWKYVSPHPVGSTSRVQIELRLPQAVASPIEYGFHSAPGAVMSIASVGARQNPVFSLRTIWVWSAASNEYRANCSKCQC